MKQQTIINRADTYCKRKAHTYKTYANNRGGDNILLDIPSNCISKMLDKPIADNAEAKNARLF